MKVNKNKSKNNIYSHVFMVALILVGLSHAQQVIGNNLNNNQNSNNSTSATYINYGYLPTIIDPYGGQLIKIQDVTDNNSSSLTIQTNSQTNQQSNLVQVLDTTNQQNYTTTNVNSSGYNGNNYSNNTNANTTTYIGTINNGNSNQQANNGNTNIASNIANNNVDYVVVIGNSLNCNRFNGTVCLQCSQGAYMKNGCCLLIDPTCQNFNTNTE